MATALGAKHGLSAAYERRYRGDPISSFLLRTREIMKLASNLDQFKTAGEETQLLGLINPLKSADFLLVLI